jgi:hypothetical protein
MTGSVVFSLDCVGKWGVADRGLDYMAFITTSRLQETYRRILDVFDKYQYKASFAFVAALCLDAEELVSRLGAIDGLFYADKDWVKVPLADLRSGHGDGWSAPRLIEYVVERSVHHVCTHGGTHLPYSDRLTSDEAVQWDIEFARAVHARLGIGWDALVFPRNIVGHLDVITRHGIRGYRGLDRQEALNGRFGKALRFFNELTNFDRLDIRKNIVRDEGNGLLALSAGKFFNAKIGLRSYISTAATRRRIVSLLKCAVDAGTTLHFYTHPHNFIRDPEMYAKLDFLLSTARKYESTHGLRILTIEDELNG